MFRVLTLVVNKRLDEWVTADRFNLEWVLEHGDEGGDRGDAQKSRKRKHEEKACFVLKARSKF